MIVEPNTYTTEPNVYTIKPNTCTIEVLLSPSLIGTYRQNFLINIYKALLKGKSSIFNYGFSLKKKRILWIKN